MLIKVDICAPIYPQPGLVSHIILPSTKRITGNCFQVHLPAIKPEELVYKF
ncbi:hypothetical protein FHS10_004656 [Mucilaginibacter dorajii]|nr:hypothetical protein [Mucilaginibacter dorajii]